MDEQMECGEVCKRFHTDEKAGLTQQEAEKRLKADGKNRLKKVREETTIDRIQKQLNDPMSFVLFMAAAVSILLREFSDTAIILIPYLSENPMPDNSERNCRDSGCYK